MQKITEYDLRSIRDRLPSGLTEIVLKLSSGIEDAESTIKDMRTEIRELRQTVNHLVEIVRATELERELRVLAKCG